MLHERCAQRIASRPLTTGQQLGVQSNGCGSESRITYRRDRSCWRRCRQSSPSGYEPEETACV
jgi:hypothetical protein